MTPLKLIASLWSQLGSKSCYNIGVWYGETLKFQEYLHPCNSLSASGTGHLKWSCCILPADGRLPRVAAGGVQHTGPRGILSPFLSLDVGSVQQHVKQLHPLFPETIAFACCSDRKKNYTAFVAEEFLDTVLYAESNFGGLWLYILKMRNQSLLWAHPRQPHWRQWSVTESRMLPVIYFT